MRHGHRRVGGLPHFGLATSRCGTLRRPHGVGVVIDGDTVERLVTEFVVAQQRIGGVGGEADQRAEAEKKEAAKAAEGVDA